MPDWLMRVDLWIIAAYLLSMLVIGWWVSDDSRDVEGYTVGNRNMDGWIVGLSVIGAYVSSITFLANPAKVYATNWNPVVFGLTLPIAALLTVPFLVPFYRRHVRLSAFEVFEKRLGVWARIYADVFFLLLQFMRIASIQCLVALAVAPMIGLNIVTVIVMAGLIVIVYDVMGGIKAVIWTDIIQVTLLLGGAIWCLVVLLGREPGGAVAAFRAVDPAKFSPGPWWTWDPKVDTVLAMLLYGLTENLRNFGTDQNYVQRMLCSKSDRQASIALAIGAIGYIPIAITFCLIGTGLFAFYEGQPDLKETLPRKEITKVERGVPVRATVVDADKVFPHFIRTELPLAVAGLIVAAILSAAMSTVDANLNACSTVLYADLIKPAMGSRPPPVPEIWILRGSTVLVGLLGTGLSVFIAMNGEGKQLFDIWNTYCGAFGGGILGLFLVAWLMPAVPAPAAMLAVAVYVITTLWSLLPRTADGAHLALIPSLPAWGFHPLLAGPIGCLLLLTIAGVARLAVAAGLLPANPRWRAAQAAENGA